MATMDTVVTKLKTRYTARPKNFADLWLSYSAQVNGGSINPDGSIITKGRYLVGQTLYNHYGGTGTLADRAKTFWAAFVP